MANQIKRMRYFDGLFLKQEEFNLEQDYHKKMRYRHNFRLHSRGVVYGLKVTLGDGVKEVMISEGMALDSTQIDGEEMSREIIVTVEQSLVLTKLNKPASGTNTAYVYITYFEDVADKDERGGGQEIHMEEKWKIDYSLGALPSEPNTVNIILAKVIIDTTGNLTITTTETDGTQLRVNAGFASTELKVDKLTLGIEGIQTGLASLEGKKFGAGSDIYGISFNSPVTQFSGDLSVTGKVNGRDIEADGLKLNSCVTDLSNHLDGVANPNPHHITPSLIGALSTSGGTMSGDITMGTYKVDGRDVSLDGLNLDTHLSPGSTNVHTASQVGALPASGLVTMSGKLTINDTSGTASASLIIDDTSANTSGIRVYRKNVVSGRSGITSIVSSGTSGAASVAAISAYSNIAGIPAIYAQNDAATGYALYVSGPSYFAGLATFTSKGAFVVDVFLNGSGKKLHTGDIVKLKGTPVTRFQGENNKIPVAEVVLADKENDGTVIGIVDREAFPEPNSPDTRTDPGDPNVIDEGGELLVVTLGAYSHCKVDATEAVIKVGDLLTSSGKNPGYAKKATDPKIGCIIGKALEPLDSGTGYIAVFVNIQ